MLASGRTRILAAVISCISVYGLTAGLGYPLISLSLEARGVSPGLIGLNAAMLALAMLTLSPMIPGLIARFGFRPLVASSLVIEALCFLALPVSLNLWFWMAVRAVMGASATVLFVAAETWVNETASDASRGRVVGIYVTMLSLTFALGPLMIPALGFEGWTPFLAAAILLMVAGIPLLLIDSTARSTAEQSTGGLLGFLRAAPLLCGAVLLFAFTEGAGLALLPVYGREISFGADAAALLITVRAAGSVCMQYPIGWLADRVDRRRLMLLSATAGAVGAAALPFCTAVPALFWPVLFLWGGLSVGVYTLAMVLLGENFQGRDLATGNAAFGMLWGIGSLTGPVAGGVVMTALGPHALPGLIALGFVVFLVVALGFRLGR